MTAPHHLLQEAWLAGLAMLREGDRWSHERLPRLRQVRSALPDTAAGRARRFTLLLHEDRTLGPSGADPDLRLAMRELDPELFTRVMARIKSDQARLFRP